MNNSRKYSCLVVDDEAPAREILVRYIDQLPMLELSGSCATTLQALNMLNTTHIDILFLDIQMPQLDGIGLIKTLKSPPHTVLTTAFKEYAIQAFELEVTDYLLKPIHFDRFLKAVARVMTRSDTQLPENDKNKTAQSVSPPFLYFRADRKMIKVLLMDILYIEGLKDYVKIFTRKDVIITKYSMAAMEAMLPDSNFRRVHRSYIVAMDKVISFTPETLEVQHYQVPIGRFYRQLILKELGRNSK